MSTRNDQDIRARVTADVGGYKRAMDEAGRATNGFTQAAKQSARELEQASTVWQRAGTVALGVFGGLQLEKAVRAVTDATIGLAKESAMLHARYETLGVVMDSVGRNVGYNRVQMAGYADEVRRMGITLVESRNTVINMAQAQMDLSKASELARIAQDAAVIGNINSSDALNRLIYGVKTSQVEVLRNIGINVSFEQSYSKLAAQLGKNVAQLSEAEKTQARMNAVVEAGAAIAGTYEASMDTAGKKVGSMARYVEDAKVIFGETFDEALIIAVDGITGGLKDLNDELGRLQQEDQLREWGRGAISTLSFVADAANNVAGTFGQMGRGLGALAAMAFARSPREAAAVWDAFKADTEQWIANADRFRRAADEQFRLADAARATKAELNGIFATFNETGKGAEALAEAQAGVIGLWLQGKLTADQYKLAMLELSGAGKRLGSALGDDGAAGGNRDLEKAARAAARELERQRQVMASWLEDVDKAAQAQREAAGQTTERMREELLTLGMTSDELARYRAEKLETAAAAAEHAAQELEAAAALLDLQGELPKVARGYRELARARREAAVNLYEQASLTRATAEQQANIDARRAAEDAARAAEAEWQRTAQSIEQSLTDALMRGFEDGKGFAENFRDTLVNMFKTLVLRPLIQPVMARVAGALVPGSPAGGVPGMGGNPMPQVGGGGFDVGNLVGYGGAGNPGIFSGAFGTPASVGAVGPMPGTGIYSPAAGTLSGAVMPGLSAYGFAQQYGVAGGLLGGIGTTALAGGFAGAAAGTGFMAGASGALAGLGPVGWAALAAGAILGGMGPNKPTNYWQGSAIDFANNTATQTGSGGRRFDQGNRDAADALGSYALGVHQMLAGLSGADSSLTELKIGVGKKDKHINGEHFRGSVEDLTNRVVDMIVESFGDTLPERYAAVVESMGESGDQVLGMLQLMVDDFGVLRTEAENFTLAKDALAGAFGDLGMDMPQGVEGFRALAAGLDLTTEAGREAYLQLAALAPAFAELVVGPRRAADDILGPLATEVERLGMTDTARSLAEITDRAEQYKQQLRDLAQATVENIAAVDEWAAAMRQAALTRETDGLLRELWRAQGDTASLRAAELATLDPLNWALQAQIWALGDQERAATTAARATSAAAQSMRALGEAGRRLGDWVRELRASDDAAASPLGQLAAARERYRLDLGAGRAGDADALGRLPSSTGAYLQAARDASTSADVYRTIFARTLAELESLPAVKSADELLLEAVRAVDTSVGGTTAAVREVKGVLNGSDEAVRALLRAGFEAIDTNLDGQLTRAELVAAFVDTGLATHADVDRLIARYDLNHDGVISRLEMLLAAERALIDATRTGFEAIDTNPDGQLTRPELVDALVATGLVTAADIDRIIVAADLNADGQLSKMEWIGAGTRALREVTKSGFAAMDADLDEMLSPAELTAALVDTGLANHEDIARLIAAVDLSGDGMISAQELTLAATRNLFAVNAQMRDQFASIDTDLDGLLTAGELEAAFVKRGLATSADIGAMMQLYDANGDGVISQLEAIEANTRNMAVQITQNYYGQQVASGGGASSSGGGYTYSASVGGQLYTVTGANAWTASGYAAKNPDVVNYWNANSALIKSLGQASTLNEYLDYHFRTWGIKEGRRFRTGGAFADGVVRRPTLFDVGLMGEDGPEAILPLANIGGSLGVRAQLPGLDALITEMRALRAEVSELRALRAEVRAVAKHTHDTAKIMTRVTNGGEAMQTEAVA